MLFRAFCVSFQLSSPLYSLHFSSTQGSLVKGPLKVSFYLDFSLLLYLHESGARESLVRSSMVSKLPYNIVFSSLLISTNLAQGYHKELFYLSLSSFLSLYCISVRLHYVQTTRNMAFLCLSTLGSQVVDVNLFINLRSLSARHSQGAEYLVFYAYLSSEGWSWAKLKNINFLLIWIPTINSVSYDLSRPPALLSLLLKRGGPP